MEIEVLYEDNHLLVINKPYGFLVHGDATGDESLEDFLKDYLKEKYNKPGNVFCSAVHRLDRPVTGVLIFAKTSKGKERMSGLFSSNDIQKEYWALSNSFPIKEKGEVEIFLKKDSKRNIVKEVKENSKGSKKALTKYEMVGRGDPYFFFKLYPHSGRSHQLRVTMKNIGSPIVGDLKYGGIKAKNRRVVYLHCHSISFVHPIKKERIIIKAPLPNLQPWHSIWHMIPKEMRKST